MDESFDSPSNEEMFDLTANQNNVLKSITVKGSRPREIQDKAKKLGAVNLISTINELMELGFVDKKYNREKKVVYLKIR